MKHWITACFRKKDEKFPHTSLHSHNQFEIYHFHSGNCKYMIHDRVYDLQPGDLILMNGLTLHRAIPLPPVPYERSVIQFSPDWIRPVTKLINMPELLSPFQKRRNCLLRTADDFSLKKIDELMQRIAEQASDASKQNPQRYSEARIKTLLVELLFHIYELCVLDERDSPNHTSEKEQHVERMIQWIDLHFTKKIHLDDIAQNLNISKYYLSHVFKEITGSTVMDYLMSRRLNWAKYLLETEPEMSISDITMDSGFESLAHFSRYFRQKLGISPTAYRKQTCSAILGPFPRQTKQHLTSACSKSG
ncbi:AraC family transcriptional regulator [Fodinisporobacter ferrooxydans]|uniref:AraC family transcriptional regulator n=1 Tax=Fodinisporobacter ferrooxydans TaxID=2901836 RepID=A0ABY4CHJ8_9BACL|nr:AraC family transcriptional regulator [Alicyclobacillaceae bacterium MYW30-H2]